MTSEILIGLGGLVLAVLTYFAGVQRTEKRLSTEKKAIRIQRVFDKYMGFRKTGYTGGYDGLQKAGVATLVSDDEIRELIDLILKHGESINPISGIEKHDLKLFFDYAATNRVDFMRATTLEEVIAKSKSKMD